ncbi:MAG: enoyl-CoA hydratase/isomerase family protein [Janthinobacterium lividum]
MTQTPFLLTQIADGLCTIRLRRPPVNVLHAPMMRELIATLDSAAADPQVRAVLLTGEGERVFSAGVEVADHTPENNSGTSNTFHRLLEALYAFPLPIVAALNGAAVGGGHEVALACDMMLSTPDAKIGQPEIKLATMAMPATLLLQQRLPPNLIAEMLLGGEYLSGERAYALGLVNRLVSKENFVADCERFMQQFTRMSRPALMVMKEALVHARAGNLAAGLAWTHALVDEKVLPLEDLAEGLQAFQEKRAPNWKHR